MASFADRPGFSQFRRLPLFSGRDVAPHCGLPLTDQTRAKPKKNSAQTREQEINKSTTKGDRENKKETQELSKMEHHNYTICCSLTAKELEISLPPFERSGRLDKGGGGRTSPLASRGATGATSSAGRCSLLLGTSADSVESSTSWVTLFGWRPSLLGWRPSAPTMFNLFEGLRRARSGCSSIGMNTSSSYRSARLP